MKKIMPWVGFSVLAATIVAAGILLASLVENRVERTSPEILGASIGVFATKATTTVYALNPSTATLIAATNTAREWLRAVATSTGIYISYGGAYIAANREPLASPYVLDTDHLYVGSIYARSDATTTVSVTEFSSP